jgi:uncharacterized protein
MPEYLPPGVYVEEIPRGPQPIEAVPTATAAFLGVAERGGTRPQLITSFNEYSRHFGAEFSAEAFLESSVQGFFENGGQRMFVCRVTGRGARPASVELPGLRIAARSPGVWGQRLWVKLGESTARDPQGGPRGVRLRVALFAPGTTPFDCFDHPVAGKDPLFVEDFDDLPRDAELPNYLDKSGLLELTRLDAAATPALMQFNGPLAAGADGTAPDAADFARALAALEDPAFAEVSLLYAPGADLTIRRTLISHCEANRFRFAVLDADRLSILTTLEPRDENPETSHAACYWPWLLVARPGGRSTREVPPGGHVLGLYSRTDAQRGVHKAPANEVLRGVVDLAQDLNARQQDDLQDLGINAIRKFPGRGIRVWGARTLSSGVEWKYVNVRRLFIFLERSIYQGTQWVVFEPNNQNLWARVTDAIRLFLRSQWRSGALLGATEDQAFFVRCDQTTMSRDDILNGRLICEIGVAALRPAEFVIFRIFHATAPESS